ncbi:MAG: hypothetical protein H6981_07235 [Gammaproteobacteria bacterium]|nr:hypothetical protein [Gammaproteobacteria bacterium]
MTTYTTPTVDDVRALLERHGINHRVAAELIGYADSRQVRKHLGGNADNRRKTSMTQLYAWSAFGLFGRGDGDERSRYDEAAGLATESSQSDANTPWHVWFALEAETTFTPDMLDAVRDDLAIRV